MKGRMADDPPKRLQEIFSALVARRIEESLEQVEALIASWRRGEVDMMVAHAEVLRHGVRASALSARIARVGLDGPEAVLRDAVQAGLVGSEEFEELTGRPVSEVPAPPSLDEELAREPRPGMPPKRTVLAKLLDDGPVLVHLDPRREGVDVPLGFRDKAQLVLRFGYGLSPPIPDLSHDELHLVGTLTFRGVPHRCVVPWEAVYAIVAEDGRGLVWPEDVPPEVAAEFQDKADRSKQPDDPEPPEPPKKRPSHLKLV
jgi:stringent starvation protein B